MTVVCHTVSRPCSPSMLRTEAGEGTHRRPLRCRLIGEAEFLNMRGMTDRGMTPMQVIQAATINVARAYRVDDDLGSLEAGKIADLVVVDGNPLSDLDHLRSVSTIVQNGRVVDRDALPTDPVLTGGTRTTRPARGGTA